MGYPIVDVDAFPVEADALRKLPYAVATKLQVIPLLVRDGRLVVALDDPARRRAAVEEIEFSAQMKVVPVLGQSRSMDDRTHAAYDQIGAVSGSRQSSLERMEAEPQAAIGTDQLVETLERENDDTLHDDRPIEQSDNSLVRLINNMIIEAYKEGASDIHIESYPGREKIRIRFRKDGVLRTYLASGRNKSAAADAAWGAGFRWSGRQDTATRCTPTTMAAWTRSRRASRPAARLRAARAWRPRCRCHCPRRMIGVNRPIPRIR